MWLKSFFLKNRPLFSNYTPFLLFCQVKILGYNGNMTEKEMGKTFAILAIFLAGFNLWAILLALLGFFYPVFLSLYFILALILATWTSWKKIKTRRLNFSFDFKKNYDFLLVAAVSFLAVIFFSAYAVPSVFSGRDQGSFSEAAIRLSQNHELHFKTRASEEFFKIYDPGRALNFPGFSYTQTGELITQFPIGYVAWLSAFYSFFGLFGLIVANALSFFVFLLVFYRLSRIFLGRQPSFLIVLFFLSSFPFFWFLKLTLSESLAAPLLWLGILNLILFFEKSERLFLIASFLSFFALSFSRLEAFALIIFAAVFFVWKMRKLSADQKIGIFKPKPWLVAIFLAIGFYLLNIWVGRAYFSTVAKGLLGSFSRDEVSLDQNFWTSFFYTLKVFNLYAVLDVLLVSLLALTFAIYKKRYDFFPVVFLTLPLFAYVFHPGISFDHPWMLRRFVFGVFPAAVFLCFWFLDSFFKRKIYFYLFSVLLLANNLAVSFPYLTFGENRELLGETEKLSREFSRSDLVLVDREASGSGFSMIASPLNFFFGLQAVYFFNPKDIQKIDTGKFENVYFIIPDKNLALYQNEFLFDKLTFQKNYVIENETLGILDQKKGDLLRLPVSLPRAQKTITEGKIYKLEKL